MPPVTPHAGVMQSLQHLSYTVGASRAPLLSQTIGANLRRSVESFGDREALVVRHQDVRLTYKELWEQTTRAARGLLACGVRKGDRVGIWSPNRYEWVVLRFAAARAGAILVNVNPAYKTAELEYALRQSGVSLLVLARQFRQADYVAMLDEVRGRCPDLRDVFVLEDDWHNLLVVGDGVDLQELAAPEVLLDCDDPINIQYTSGTTGAPKGATLSHRNVMNNAFLTTEQIRLTEFDRLCAPVPLYHCFGCVAAVLGCATHGACLVLPSESFEPLSHWELISMPRPRRGLSKAAMSSTRSPARSRRATRDARRAREFRRRQPDRRCDFDAVQMPTGTERNGTPGPRLPHRARLARGLRSVAGHAVRRTDPPSASLENGMQLFVQRAIAARPSVAIEDAEVRYLVGRLDGLPLAIELAAAKVRVMSVAEIAERLDNRFELLRGGSRDAPERHQTLLAVIDWSWSRLAAAEQAALRRIAVFRDGFSLAGATAAVTSDGREVLTNLIEQSLVVVREDGSGVRYRLLETVREFVCLFSSIGYVATLDRLRLTARTISRQLEPGGVALVEPWLMPDTFQPGHVHALLAEAPDLKVVRMELSYRLIDVGLIEVDDYRGAAFRDDLLRDPNPTPRVPPVVTATLFSPAVTGAPFRFEVNLSPRRSGGRRSSAAASSRSHQCSSR